MRATHCIAWLLALFAFPSCGKKEGPDTTPAQEHEPGLSVEDQVDDRKRRRERIARERELYLARLKESAREYGKEQSRPVVEENLQIFKARYDGYLNEIYLPELEKRDLDLNPAPENIAPARDRTFAVNFYTEESYRIPPERMAGLAAVMVKNWNNASHELRRAEHGERLKGELKELQLCNGSKAPSLHVSWQAHRLENRGNSPGPDTEGSLLLMSSNLEGDEISLSLEGLKEAGFERYDLVLYTEHVLDENQQDAAQQPISRVDLWADSSRESLVASDIVSGVKVSGRPYEGQVRSFTRQDSRDRNFICANTGKPGHYVYFANLDAPSLFIELGRPIFGKLSAIRLAGFEVIAR